MLINIVVKVRGGPRTPVGVEVHGTAVNTKVLRFANGKTVSEHAIAEWIELYLSEMLTDVQLRKKDE